MAVVTSPDRPNLAQLELGETLAPETWDTVVALQNHVAAESCIVVVSWDGVSVPAGTTTTDVAEFVVRIPAGIDSLKIFSLADHAVVTVDGTALTHSGATSVQTATHSVTPDAIWTCTISVASVAGGTVQSVVVLYDSVSVP